MIQKLVIKNFQSHKCTKLDFHQGVNVIVGESDSGKSAIIRAINWVVNNKPNGDSIRRTNSKETVVKLDNIIRSKTKLKNSYHIGDKEYKSFGANVPEQVKDATGLTGLNFQYQSDSHFLFSSSPGEISTYINKLVNLDKIDSSLVNINRMTRSTSVQLECIKKTVKENGIELEQYKGIEILDKKLFKLQIIKKRIIQNQDKHDKLNIHLIEIEDLQSTYINLPIPSYIHKFKKEIEFLLHAQNHIKEKEEKEYKLTNVLNEIDNLNSDLMKMIKDLQENKKLFKKLMPKICPLCAK